MYGRVQCSIEQQMTNHKQQPTTIREQRPETMSGCCCCCYYCYCCCFVDSEDQAGLQPVDLDLPAHQLSLHRPHRSISRLPEVFHPCYMPSRSRKVTRYRRILLVFLVVAQHPQEMMLVVINHNEELQIITTNKVKANPLMNITSFALDGMRGKL